MMIPELTLPALFTAGLAASPHCALMCGPLHSLRRGAAVTDWRGLVGLQAGRVVGYAVLGALAGSIGFWLLSYLPSPRWGQGLQGMAALACMLLGIWQLKRVPLHDCAAHGVNPSAQVSVLQQFGQGLGLSLVPCGLLYGVLFLAAVSGGPVTGAALLAAFALGGIPALAGSAYWLRRRGYPKYLAAVLLVLAGLSSLIMVLVGAEAAQGFWCYSPS